jgi:NAD(P)-dependent dehydrogenase (short-subunit alcohol dehydrogenase family)
MAINFMGAYAVTKTLFPLLYARKGRVVNISSEAAKFATAFGLYGISKQCLESYHTALRQELALLGMEAILIRPGAHDTPMSDGIRAGQGTGDEGSLFQKEMQRMQEQAREAVSEPGDPRDVARAVFEALTAEKPKPIYEVNADRRLTALAKLPSEMRARLMAKAR